MGCMHTTIEMPEGTENQAKESSNVISYSPRLCKVHNDVPQNEVNVNVASVKLKALQETTFCEDKDRSLMYQTNMLKSSDSTNTGSSLSLSDVETYRKKKFPKWRGYRKCKYCTDEESLRSSFKSVCESGSFEAKKDVSSTDELVKPPEKRNKQKGKMVPRGLPSRNSCRNCSTKLTREEPLKNNMPNNVLTELHTSRYIDLLAMVSEIYLLCIYRFLSYLHEKKVRMYASNISHIS